MAVMESVTSTHQARESVVDRVELGSDPEVSPKMDLELVQVRLRCPIVPAIHPAAEAARLHTLDWVLAHDLARPGDERYPIVCELLASALPARCWPAVTVEQLKLASDWLAFLSLYQHAVGTAELRDAETLARLSATEDRFAAMIEGAEPFGAGDLGSWDDLAWALRDLRRRLAAEGPSQGWLRRFASHTAGFFDGTRWERLLDLEDPVPALTAYRHRRLLNSAVFTCFDLAALFLPELAPASIEGPVVRALEDMASNYVNWVDDLFHFEREMAAGKKANLVRILEERLGLPRAKARDEAIDMCNREIETFFETALEIEPWEEMRPGVEAYVGALKAWMRGNLDAYGVSRRYAEPLLALRRG